MHGSFKTKRKVGLASELSFGQKWSGENHVNPVSQST